MAGPPGKKEAPTANPSGFDRRPVFLVFLLVLIYAAIQVFFRTPAVALPAVEYGVFLDQVEAGNVAEVEIQGLVAQGKLVKETPLLLVGAAGKPVLVSGFTTLLPAFQGEALIAKLREHKVRIGVRKPVEESPLWRMITGVLPWVLIVGVWIYVMRRASKGIGGGAGGLFSFGESKARVFAEATHPHITFADVAGMENVKVELREIIEFLKDPKKFTAIGARVPKGVLLIGAPGTGKTLLARATAGEAGVPFFSINASEFVEMFVGVGASRVRDLMKKAKAAKPSIVFIDEIDAVGRTRGAGFGGGHDEREQTLNQLLAEMDGFETNEELIVMAASNRPDVLDPALLRPGRFDKHIVVDRPGLKERRAILEIHTRKKKLAENVDLEHIAQGTIGMTGADLERLANVAALIALRKGRESVEMRDFEEARDESLMGMVREETISASERRITAYHEAGHTVVAWELPGTDPVHKVGIVPRGQAMGATQLQPREDRHYYPRAYLLGKLTVGLGGRVAERLVFADTSTGAQSDLKEATALAEKMVAQWGMSEKIGPMYVDRGEEHPFLGRKLTEGKSYSERLAWLMDEEIRSFVLDAESRADAILSQNRESLEKLAQALLAEEVLDKARIEAVIGHPKR
ncbi:MAG TPA: ATP-dependent zinc metalloprotease FtsH [Candidatus Methanoperedens sp.]|nr:ATP-dependent zinc metalloprotease FtsH [Candidatus Methanoperedens sp.]